MCTCTDVKQEKLPHFILTYDKDWDPTVLDCEGQVDNDAWVDAQSSFSDSPTDKTFNELGDYRLRSNDHKF